MYTSIFQNDEIKGQENDSVALPVDPRRAEDLDEEDEENHCENAVVDKAVNRLADVRDEDEGDPTDPVVQDKDKGDVELPEIPLEDIKK